MLKSLLSLASLASLAFIAAPQLIAIAIITWERKRQDSILDGLRKT